MARRAGALRNLRPRAITISSIIISIIGMSIVIVIDIVIEVIMRHDAFEPQSFIRSARAAPPRVPKAPALRAMAYLVIFTYVYMCIYIYVCVCIYVYMYTCIYVYTHIYI